MYLSPGKSSVLKSLGGVSSVLTNIILATSPHSAGAAAAEANRKISNKEDAIVMDTKLKIIEILQVLLFTLTKDYRNLYWQCPHISHIQLA